MVSQLAMIADDLTGAADAGAPFALGGFATVLALAPGPLPQADVLVVTTESRRLPAPKARDRAYEAASRLRGSEWVFKKIDSTLRGQPGAELDAVMDALGLEQALVAPAFPAQGRTTVDGRQRVDGRLLEQTPFARESPNSDISTVLRQGADRPTKLIDLDTVRLGVDAVCAAISSQGIFIADAETDDDLTTLASAAARCRVRLLCGSSGLARALIGALPLTPTPMPLIPAHQTSRPVLIVAGSRHPRTRRQVYAAGDYGANVITPDAGFLTNQQDLDALTETVRQSLATGRHTVLSTAAMRDAPVSGEVIAATLAGIVRRLALHVAPGALALTGGDIAAAVLAALEATAVHLQGELESGIPWGVMEGGLLPGAPVVTKAGGFGHDDALAEAIGFLAPVGAN
jgi:uncharacterized protein YgbK (DUF1537 family)